MTLDANVDLEKSWAEQIEKFWTAQTQAFTRFWG